MSNVINSTLAERRARRLTAETKVIDATDPEVDGKTADDTAGADPAADPAEAKAAKQKA